MAKVWPRYPERTQASYGCKALLPTSTKPETQHKKSTSHATTTTKKQYPCTVCIVYYFHSELARIVDYNRTHAVHTKVTFGCDFRRASIVALDMATSAAATTDASSVAFV